MFSVNSSRYTEERFILPTQTIRNVYNNAQFDTRSSFPVGFRITDLVAENYKLVTRCYGFDFTTTLKTKRRTSIINCGKQNVLTVDRIKYGALEIGYPKNGSFYSVSSIERRLKPC